MIDHEITHFDVRHVLVATYNVSKKCAFRLKSFNANTNAAALVVYHLCDVVLPQVAGICRLKSRPNIEDVAGTFTESLDRFD